MKRLFVLFISLIVFALSTQAEETMLSTGVSVNDVPKAFFGSWLVTAKLDDSNNYKIFKPQSIDVWNLTRVFNKITLENTYTGASANISIKAVEGNLMVFSKQNTYDNKLFIETVSIRLEDGKFSGIDSLTIETRSMIDNHLMKTETARYIIKGEKIAGESVLQK